MDVRPLDSELLEIEGVFLLWAVRAEIPDAVWLASDVSRFQSRTLAADA